MTRARFVALLQKPLKSVKNCLFINMRKQWNESLISERIICIIQFMNSFASLPHTSWRNGDLRLGASWGFRENKGERLDARQHLLPQEIPFSSRKEKRWRGKTLWGVNGTKNYPHVTTKSMKKELLIGRHYMDIPVPDVKKGTSYDRWSDAAKHVKNVVRSRPWNVNANEQTTFADESTCVSTSSRTFCWLTHTKLKVLRRK